MHRQSLPNNPTDAAAYGARLTDRAGGGYYARQKAARDPVDLAALLMHEARGDVRAALTSASRSVPARSNLPGHAWDASSWVWVEVCALLMRLL